MYVCPSKEKSSTLSFTYEGKHLNNVAQVLLKIFVKFIWIIKSRNLLVKSFVNNLVININP